MKVYFYELRNGLTVSSTNHPLEFFAARLDIHHEADVCVIRDGVVHSVEKSSLSFKSSDVILMYAVEPKEVKTSPVEQPSSTKVTSPTPKITGFVNGDYRLPMATNGWSHVGDNPGETFIFGHHKGRKFTEKQFLVSSSTDVAYYCGIKLLNNVYRKMHDLQTLSAPEEREIKDSLENARIPIKLSPEFKTGAFKCF